MSKFRLGRETDDIERTASALIVISEKMKPLYRASRIARRRGGREVSNGIAEALIRKPGEVSSMCSHDTVGHCVENGQRLGASPTSHVANALSDIC